jgi:hypothetical protein
MENIKQLFPLKGQITQEIIDSAKLSHPQECIGALTLKQSIASAGITDSLFIGWGIVGGTIDKSTVDPNSSLAVGTEDRVNMMTVKEPTEVTFILLPEYAFATDEEANAASLATKQEYEN